MKLKIVPYKMTSEGAKLLQKKLSELVGYYVYRGRAVKDHKLIQWGTSPDKLRNFKLMADRGVPTVPFTTSKKEAQKWLDAGHVVYARTPGGERGKNIHVVQPNELLPDMPLYTRRVKNWTEFRVNVAYDKAIHFSEKRQAVEVKKINKYVRSQDGGWSFRRPTTPIPAELAQIAVNATKAVGLELSGVDIIWNKFYNKCYVLEVNSAPWLNENIANKYATEIVSKHGVPQA